VDETVFIGSVTEFVGKDVYTGFWVIILLFRVVVEAAPIKSVVINIKNIIIK